MHPALSASSEVGGAVMRWAALDDPRLSQWELLNAADVDRMQRFRFAADRERYARARCALRLVIGEHTGVHPRDVPLLTDARGAPRPVDGLRFSVSHSADLAVVAVAFGRRVGVDVELPSSGVAGVVAAFHPGEQAWIAATAAAARESAMLRCWTAKEAYLKALGVGLLRPLDSFSVVPTEGQALALSDSQDSAAARDWCLTALPAPGDAVATLAVERSGAQPA